MNIFKVIGWTNFDNEDFPVCDESIAIDYESVTGLMRERGRDALNKLYQ